MEVIIMVWTDMALSPQYMILYPNMFEEVHILVPVSAHFCFGKVHIIVSRSAPEKIWEREVHKVTIGSINVQFLEVQSPHEVLEKIIYSEEHKYESGK